MKAIFPGSFDPPTLGHIDLIRRGSELFGTIIVAVLQNSAKTPLFSVQERVDILKTELSEIPGIEVKSAEGLLADFAREQEVKYILRGVRTEADCAYEISMAQANKELAGLETIMLATDPAYSYISSSLVREVFLQKNQKTSVNVLNKWVPPAVIAKIDKVNKTGG